MLKILLVGLGGSLGAISRYLVSEFVARRNGTSPTDMFALVVGRTTLAACRAAYEVWAASPEGDLANYLDEALHILAE